jgi:hypothetical protein
LTLPPAAFCRMNFVFTPVVMVEPDWKRKMSLGPPCRVT